MSGYSGYILEFTRAYSVHPLFVTRYNTREFPFILEIEDGEIAFIITDFDKKTLELGAQLVSKEIHAENEPPDMYYGCCRAFAKWLEEYLGCWSDQKMGAPFLPIRIFF